MTSTSLIIFHCPDCHACLSAGLELDGSLAVCPRCGVELVVPDPGFERDSPAAAGQRVAEVSSPARRRSTLVDGEMDMTPMVDVTFLLLIFFMVTAAFAMQKSFEIPTPQNNAPSRTATLVEPLEDDPLVVTVRIDEYNTYYVSGSAWEEEQEAPTRQELMTRLHDAQQTSAPPTTMLILAHPECALERVVGALDAGNALKMENVKLLTVEDTP